MIFSIGGQVVEEGDLGIKIVNVPTNREEQYHFFVDKYAKGDIFLASSKIRKIILDNGLDRQVRKEGEFQIGYYVFKINKQRKVLSSK